MPKTSDRARRSGSDPIIIGSSKIATDSNNDISIVDTSGNAKKIIASELHLGTDANKVILKRSSTDGKLQLQTTDGSSTSNSEVSGDSGGSGGVTVQEEGSALSTTATTLNFVGSSVTASGSGATKTITITAGSGGTTTVYASIAAMTATSPSAGDQALVTANSGLYIYNGNGWYKIATVNTSPTISSPASGSSYTLATNGTPTSIEIVGADVDEGTTLQNSYAVTSGSITNVATVTSSSTSGGTYSALNPSTNTTNRFFKITPNTNDVAGSFTLTFSVSDNVNAATTVQSFTLAFEVSGSLNFDGSSDYISTPSSSDFTLGTGDFTIEFWAWPKNFTNRGTFYDSRASSGTTGITIGHEASSGEIRVYMNASSGSDIAVQSSDFNVKTWQHVAVTRESGTVRLFIGGVLKDTGTASDNMSNTNAVNIGYKSNTSSSYNYYTGYMSNLRIVKGTAVYTSAFTPATSPLSAISGTVYLIANNNTPITITNGSYYVGSTSNSHVTTSTSSDFTLGTNNDFTVEFWYKFGGSSVSSGGYFFDMGDNTFTVYAASTSRLDVWGVGGTINNGGSNVGTSVGVWHHMAVQRAGNVHTFYINGQLQGSKTDSSNAHNFNGNKLRIGNYGGGNGGPYGQNAYYSDFRFVKGTAVYSGNFTPPSGPLTLTGGTYPSNTNVNTSIPSGNTKLLTANHSSGSYDDDSSSNHTLTAAGTVSLSDGYQKHTEDASSSSHDLTFYGDVTFDYPTPFVNGPGGSVYFDGNGDSLVTPTSSDFTFGTGDFTIEFWYYPINFSAERIMTDRRSGSGGEEIVINHNTDGTIRLWANSSYRITSTATNVGAWTHIAVVRASSSTKMYINGTAQSTTYSDSTNYSGTRVTLGNYYASNSAQFYGYISNYREVKGTAVYTSNFTVSTTSLTAVTNTKLLTCNDSNVINDASSSNHTITVNGDTIPTKLNPF